jgi:hypothetical protein
MKLKKGDKVYDYQHGWGEVSGIMKISANEYYVLFEKWSFFYDFNGVKQGYCNEKPSLSLTEYNYETGGFTNINNQKP